MSPVAEQQKHLNADGFSAFVDNTMSEPERLEVIAHIADCGQCREVIVLLQEAGSVAEPIVLVETARDGVRGARGLMVAGIALLGVAIAALAFVLGRQSEPRVVPAAPPQVIVQNIPPASPAPQIIVREHTQAVQPAAKPKPADEPKPVEAAKPVEAPKSVEEQNQVATVPMPYPGATPSVAADDGFQGSSHGESSHGGYRRWRPNPLPSMLPAIAAVSRVHQKLAADTNSRLFFSNDGGGHWRAVTQQWNGRIVRLVTSSGPADGQTSATGTWHDGGPIPATGKSRYELTTDTGGVWISFDGVHWRQP